MSRLAAVAALLVAAAPAWAVPGGDTAQGSAEAGRGRGMVASAEAVGGRATVSIRLTARVVSTTTISLSGRAGTRLVAAGDQARLHLGLVDSEATLGRGRAVERADDGGAFHIADVRAAVGFSNGVRGQLLVSGEVIEDGPGIDFRYACGEVPTSAYRTAGGAQAPGTQSIRDGEHVCAAGLADRDHVDLELALHVGDETPEGRYGATYFVTAVPDLI